MKLKEVHSIIYDIRQKGYESGLTIEDYKKLKQIINCFDQHHVATNQKWYDAYSELSDILNEIYESGILHKISSANCKYIIENSSLLPLVLANNVHPKIKMYSDNSYMFLCQHHVEKTPSMGVSDIINLFHCYGCGWCNNAVNYLEIVESLNYVETIELLAQIYLYDIHRQNNKLLSIAEKYQRSITSDEYMELLQQGHDRLKNRGIEIFNGVNVEEYYRNKFKTIERIKNNEYDPHFKYIEPPKTIRLIRK